MKPRSEQFAELVWCHADGGQDATQGALGNVLTSMYRNSNGTPVRMAHDVVATACPRDRESGALKRLHNLRSRYRRDGARHKAASYQRSGNVECQRQLVRYPDFFDEQLHAGAQVGDRGLLRRPVAERGDTRTELSRGAPNAVFVLLDDVGHVNDTSHDPKYGMSSIAARLSMFLYSPRGGRLGTSCVMVVGNGCAAPETGGSR